MGMVYCRGCGKEIHESAPTCPHCGAPQLPPPAIPSAGGVIVTTTKSQTVAALLSAFLGGLGAHRFYLGPIWLGVIYLLFCWTGIPGLIAFVETLIIIFSSQDTWARKYNNGVITPPCHIAVKILVCLLPAVAIIGIVAAVAIPAYQEYTIRAKVADAMSAMAPAKVKLADHLATSPKTGLTNEELGSIKTELLANKYIANADAFAYSTYADVGVQLKDVGKERSIFLVTQDSGATWQCVTTDSDTKTLPKNCSMIGSIERPAIPPPVVMVGLWHESTYKDMLKGCTERGIERGEPNAAQFCNCLIGKASNMISEKLIEYRDVNAEFKNMINQIATECQG